MLIMQPSCSHGEVQTDDGEEPYRQYRLAINARLQNMREKAIIREFGHP